MEPIPRPSRTLLTTNQAAQYLSVHPGTLQNWRSFDMGPTVTRVGRLCYYSQAALDEWRRKGSAA